MVNIGKDRKSRWVQEYVEELYSEDSLPVNGMEQEIEIDYRR